jgi:hypothetical protein
MCICTTSSTHRFSRTLLPQDARPELAARKQNTENTGSEAAQIADTDARNSLSLSTLSFPLNNHHRRGTIPYVHSACDAISHLRQPPSNVEIF